MGTSSLCQNMDVLPKTTLSNTHIHRHERQTHAANHTTHNNKLHNTHMLLHEDQTQRSQPSLATSRSISVHMQYIYCIYIYIYKYTYILYILYILPNLFRTWYTPHYWIITPIMVLIESGARAIVRTIEMQHQKNPG